MQSIDYVNSLKIVFIVVLAFMRIHWLSVLMISLPMMIVIFSEISISAIEVVRALQLLTFAI